jgi:hypothetical protein
MCTKHTWNCRRAYNATRTLRTSGKAFGACIGIVWGENASNFPSPACKMSALYPSTCNDELHNAQEVSQLAVSQAASLAKHSDIDGILRVTSALIH